MAILRRKVQKIIDGDTFKVHRSVGGSQYIRVADVNAPERGRKGYDSAKRRLSRMTGKTVSIRPVGRSYGRTVAKVPYAKRLMKKR